MNGAALAEGNHLLGDGSGGLGFGQSGHDAFMFDEAANQVGKHRIPVLAGAA